MNHLSKLSVRTVDPGAVPGAGLPDITSSDVAAALAYGLSPAAQHLGLYLFTGDSLSRDVVIKCLAVNIATHYTKEISRGEEMPSETAEGLALSVLSEMSDRRRCRRCKGSGTVFMKVQGDQLKPGNTPAITKSLTACPKCGGEGVESMSDFQRARLAGLNSRTLNRRYAGARGAGSRAFGAWLNELRDHLHAQLNEEGDEPAKH